MNDNPTIVLSELGGEVTVSLTSAYTDGDVQLLIVALAKAELYLQRLIPQDSR